MYTGGTWRPFRHDRNVSEASSFQICVSHGHRMACSQPSPDYYALQLIAVLGNVGADEAHVPAIRVVAIDGDNGAVLFVKRTIRPWHVDRETIYTVAAVTLN